MGANERSGKSTKSAARDLASLDELAEIFAALGSAPRLRLLYLLHRDPDLTVGELAEQAGIAISGVSTHIQRLKRAGLVCCRRDGQSVCCALEGKSRHIRFVRDIFRSIAGGKGCC